MSETQCTVCGTEEEPDKGWIYKREHLQAAEIAEDGLKFDPKPDAEPICSTDCLDEYKAR